VTAESPIPTHHHEGSKVFNLRALKEPSAVDRHTEPEEREGVRDFMAQYRLPTVNRLADPLSKLKAYLGSPGPSFSISRFSDGSYPAVYMADSDGTSLAEVSFHLAERLRETTAEKTKIHTFQLSLFILKGETVDVRVGFPKLHLKDDWSPAQPFGAEMRTAGAKGITFKSVRKPGGVCTAVFRATLVEDGLPLPAVSLQWDGRKLVQV
jgi:hypothetical protein